MAIPIVQWVLMVDLVVSAVTAGLGHAEYPRREAAGAALRSLGVLALPLVGRAQSSSDLEVAWRATGLTAQIRRDQAEQLVTHRWGSGQCQLPWLDMLPFETPDREAVLQRYLVLAAVPGCKPEPAGWPGYRQATLLYVRDLLREGKSQQEVAALLDAMWEREQQWRLADPQPVQDLGQDEWGQPIIDEPIKMRR